MVVSQSFEFYLGEVVHRKRSGAYGVNSAFRSSCAVCERVIRRGWSLRTIKSVWRKGEMSEVKGNQPLVSIGLPVYNGENFLEETLRSLLGQSFTNYELIISDNASTDRTQEICERYAASDSRIRYYRNETNLGAAWNFNRVFLLSRGEYFKWAAHDDLCTPDYLEKCVAVMEADTSIVLCHSRVHMIDSRGTILVNDDISPRASSRYPHERFSDVLRAYMCFEIFGLIRSCILRHTPLMGNFAHGDGILLAWLGLWGRFHEIPEYLFYSRRHPEQAGSRLMNRYMWAEWFDPAMKGRLVFPHWRMLREYLRAVSHVPMARRERWWCWGYMGRWVIWYRRRLWGNLVEVMKNGTMDLKGGAERNTSGYRFENRLPAMEQSRGVSSEYGKDGR